MKELIYQILIETAALIGSSIASGAGVWLWKSYKRIVSIDESLKKIAKAYDELIGRVYKVETRVEGCEQRLDGHEREIKGIKAHVGLVTKPTQPNRREGHHS